MFNLTYNIRIGWYDTAGHDPVLAEICRDTTDSIKNIIIPKVSVLSYVWFRPNFMAIAMVYLTAYLEEPTKA